MKIDQTRVKAFWQNPERYRLQYQLDIVPQDMAYGLARGIAFHTTLDLVTLGKTAQEIEDILAGRVPDQYGRVLKLGRNAIENGVNMAEAYLATDRYTVLQSESEFEFAIEGSPHTGVGRLDRMLSDGWLQEFKTASNRAQAGRKLDDWAQDIQADMEILGARALGFEPLGVKVQYVVESVPPAVWEEFPIKRTEGELSRTKLFIHQTCETIEMYLATFGLEQPWPHIPNTYPCWGTGEKCEYRHICRKAGCMSPEALSGFKRREEHLVIMK